MPIANYLFNLANVCCEKCQTQLKLKDFKDHKEDKKALICGSCGHAIPLDLEEGLRLVFDKSLARPSPQVFIQREASIFRIEKKWHSKNSKYIVLACLFWNLGLASLTWLFLFHLDSNSEWRLLYLSGLTVSALMGLRLLYRCLQEFFNTTMILIKNNKLVIGTLPLSTAPVKIYKVADIQRFTLWRPHLIGKQHGHPVFTFGVDVQLKNGKVEKLCPASDLNEAIYIEKTIEEFLSIEEAPVVDPDLDLDLELNVV